MNNNQIQMALQNTKRDTNLKLVNFKKGDNVWVWRKFAPNKMEYRFDGPHKILRRLNENSYEIEIAPKKVNGKNYQRKTSKNVSSKHLRLYTNHLRMILKIQPHSGYYKTRMKKIYPLLLRRICIV